MRFLNLFGSHKDENDLIQDLQRYYSHFVLLISVKPKFSQLILNRKKKVELRKRFPSKYVNHALIYESAPTKEVTGAFRIRKLYMRKVHRSESLSKPASITLKQFNHYYLGVKNGTIIEIDQVFKFSRGITLPERRSFLGINPPQGYVYLPTQRVLRMLNDGSGRAYR